MKAQCTSIATCDLLVIELKQRFLDHELMNALSIIYPQYCLQLDCKSTFVDHLSLIKRHYCITQKLGVNGIWVSKAFSRQILDLQTSIFKLTMKRHVSKAMA